MIDHWKNITNTFVTDPLILEEAKKFASEWAKKKLPSPEEFIPPFGHSSTSACYSGEPGMFTRKHGGYD